MADVIADTEANVIGGEESADRTGVHPKVVFDEEGRPVRIERPGHRGHRHGRGRN